MYFKKIKNKFLNFCSHFKKQKNEKNIEKNSVFLSDGCLKILEEIHNELAFYYIKNNKKPNRIIMPIEKEVYFLEFVAYLQKQHPPVDYSIYGTKALGVWVSFSKNNIASFAFYDKKINDNFDAINK